MSETLLPLGLVLNTLAWLAAWYRGSERRPSHREAAASHRRRTLALVGFVCQLVASALWVGALAGPAIVLCAWMLLGTAFVPAVNARPARVLSVASWLGAAGGVLVVIPLLLSLRR